jgi:short-subunit dehydrogenase
VHVTALCPGMTYSEFHDVTGMREKVSKLPKAIWLTADQVARIGVDAVEAGKSRVVTGGANRMIAAMAKYLPDALSGSLIARRSKDFRDAD